jgi:hypothetical protein
LPSARTSIGNAAMEFISSTGTCQVPVPVLALPFSSTGTCQVPLPVLAWLFAAQTSEFYRTLEKLRIRK